MYAIINGEKVNSADTFSRENPADPSETAAYAPLITREEASISARNAFPAWEDNPVEE
ncbi:hypothetical protein [Alteribacillus sp. YIM 98480]|uniref:hypothetical protein n=1 Tax=Alteribacillus sp. YIM 98480 TaxID=2606599 RepID=UPI00131BA0A4|nr:hypothetical protein [Alteribacillus sp. YIM 98480]